MRRAAFLLPFLALAAACQQPATAAETVVLAPAAQSQANEPRALQTAVFAGGCFWGVEGVFSHVTGVTSAVSGYHGGVRNTARYERVSDGDTGHAEAVRVTYDPARVRYDQLLRIFFSVVTDPTELNRQGPDVGTQYRNALVPTTPEQRRVAEAYLAQLRASGLWHAPIVTRIEAYQQFYPAETYHQDFMLANPDHPYIMRWDAPKVAALRRLFPGEYKRGFTTG
ncbi:MAG: peptide-methionine (S)-S-oxide reductase MsrA [Sphingomonadales bacterium]|nr:peptide-methionine (S)-S-oxide reductase MsrA [Sphingomonadales bacterium]